MAQKEETFTLQTAGHAGSFLKQGNDKIMKPVSNNEVSFYEGYYKQFKELQPFAPKYYGHEKKENKTYIIMEDLTHYYKKACIMDIKMGVTSVGEDATPEKKASMAAKDNSTTTVTLGLRICGLKVFQPKSGEYVSKDKSWGKKVKDNNFLESISVFFNNGTHVRKELIAKYLPILERLLVYFEKQHDLRFYSSSLLFLYDGQEEGKDPHVDIRMIDFAHVHPIKDKGKDDGYLKGLRNLITFLQKLK